MLVVLQVELILILLLKIAIQRLLFLQHMDVVVLLPQGLVIVGSQL